MKYIEFQDIKKQSTNYKCPWKNKDVSVKILTSEINKIKPTIGNNLASFYVMLSPLLEWETNLLVDENGIPLSQTGLAEALDLSTRTIRSNISTLIENNLVHKIEDNKRAYYVVNPKYMYFGKNASIDLLKIFMTMEEIEYENFNYRNCEAYKHWRDKVLLRDNYTCQCCGSHDRLEVHHIENFSSNSEKRYDIDNGISLCEKCHSNKKKGSFHQIYGTRDNTRQQLDEYIKNHNQN